MQCDHIMILLNCAKVGIVAHGADRKAIYSYIHYIGYVQI
jgi:hypothetical protein